VRPLDFFSPESAQPEAREWSAVVAGVAAWVRTLELPGSSPREPESVRALIRELEYRESELQEPKENLASAQKHSKQRPASAPQKKENPWSALAPQCLLLNCSLQCNRGRPWACTQRQVSL
jgi:hypothetical protein